MLQHNNNNNHPCLDVAHRELLHGCKRGGATFSSALGFNAIPLIKGLRAWAVSGGYSRSRKKVATAYQVSETPYESQTGITHRKTHNVVGSLRTPRVRQGGPGALVTVATLKDSDGGRQTQTRCLFLKADGESYLCTVRTRATDRASGRFGQESVRCCDAKPQVARKWRKPSKKPKSAENIARAEDKKDPIVKCQQAKQSHTNTSSVGVHHGKDNTDSCEETTDTFISKNNDSIGVEKDEALDSSPKNHSNEDRIIHDSSIPTADNTTESQDLYPCPKSKKSEIKTLTTGNHNHSEISDISKSEVEILQNKNLNRFSISKVLRSEEFGLTSNNPVQDTSNRDETLFAVSNGHHDKDEHSLVISGCCRETRITYALGNSSDASSKEHRDKHELITRTEDKVNGEMEQYEVMNIKKDDNLEGFPQNKADIITTSDIVNAVNTNTRQFQLSNSSSQGSSLFRPTREATPPSNLPNPNTLRSLISQDEEGVEGERLVLTPFSELLMKSNRDQEKNKVADKETDIGDEEEEDEFGFFVKAGDEKEFNELQIVPCDKQDDMDYTNYSDANEPSSWAPEWTEGLPINQSGGSWTAFKQDSRGLETECWLLIAEENTNLKKSSLRNVFSGAFPALIQSFEDSEFVPTLKELLQAPEQRNKTVQEGSQSLLYGLHDLDHMIGLKYKRAESLSRKLLLHSLHLSAVISDGNACGRKPNTARFSPNLPTSNQQLVANAKRRFSYDINRNINP